jgi:CBS domain containing-hemolysin-like protein
MKNRYCKLESESELPPHKKFPSVVRFIFAGFFAGLMVLLLWNSVSEARPPLNADPSVSASCFLSFLVVGLGLGIGLVGAFHFTLLKCVFFAFDPEEFQDYMRLHTRFAERLRVLSASLDRTWFTLLGGWLLSGLLYILSGFSFLILVQNSGSWPCAYSLSLLLALVLLFYFFGELLPSVFAVRNLKALTPASVAVLKFWSVALAPLILPLVRLLRGTARLRGHEISERFKSLTVETRLLSLISASRVNVSLEEDEREMIDHVLEFGQSTAGDIMTPKSGIVGFDTSTSQAEALEIMRGTPRSRVLVYDGSLNDIVGVLHTKQILLNPDSDYHLQLHDPLFVEEDMDLVELLALIRSEHTQLAIVLDRWGTTMGVVTFDDLLGAIVGPAAGEEEGESVPPVAPLPVVESPGGPQ